MGFGEFFGSAGRWASPIKGLKVTAGRGPLDPTDSIKIIQEKYLVFHTTRSTDQSKKIMGNNVFSDQTTIYGILLSRRTCRTKVVQNHH